MPVFLLKTDPDSEGVFSLKTQDLHHLQQVLRLRAGDRFEALLPDGRKVRAKLIEDDTGLRGLVEETLRENAPPTLPMEIGLGLTKWSRLEGLVEKLTELGVKRLCLLKLQQGRYGGNIENSTNKINRLNKISNESLKQCERPNPLEIKGPLGLEAWLSTLSQGDSQKILLDENCTQPLLSSQTFKNKSRTIFLIGPEGGLSPEERELAQAGGFASVSLGEARLRSETSALYAAVALNQFLNLTRHGN